MGSRCVIRVLGICLLLSPILAAQTISAPAKVTADPGEVAAVRVTWEGSEVRYSASPGLNTIREYDPDAKVLALRVWAKEPGNYTVTLIASSATGKLTDFHTVQIVVGNKAPQPPPVVPPGPAAKGCPGCWVIVVEQSGEPRTTALAKILTDRSLWKSVEDAGLKWVVLSSEDPAAMQGGYSKAADKVGCPALLLVTTEGKVESSRTLKTADDIKNVTKEATGK
jgi:hypothetical protein